MATSKKSLIEQIQRRLNGGNPSVASKVHYKEIEAACMQVVNSLLKPQYFENLALADGLVPEGCVICTYDGIDVEEWKDVSRITLPVIPVALPKNMGLWRIVGISEVDGEFTNEFSDEFNIGGANTGFDEFIPIPNGQFSFIKKQRLISDLLGRVGYEVRGKQVVFTTNLVTAGMPKVSVEMIVMDMSKYSDYELLPINPELEFQVVDTVYKMFAPIPVHPQIVDSTSDTK